MTRTVFSFVLTVWAALLFSPSGVAAQSDGEAASKLTLQSAVTCEGIAAYQPVNAGVVFSISNGKVVCFTAFSLVPEETVITHDWYRRDQLSTSRRLTLKPPRWSTFTEIILREADKGPWRVEVINETGQKIAVLRFSVTE